MVGQPNSNYILIRVQKTLDVDSLKKLIIISVCVSLKEIGVE